MAPDALKQELERYLEAHPETRYLETLVADMNGILRGKRAERHDFNKLFRNGMNLCAATAILDTRGQTFSSIPYGGADGDPDVKGVAVAGSLAPVPWVNLPTAQVLVEIAVHQGSAQCTAGCAAASARHGPATGDGNGTGVLPGRARRRPLPA